MHPVLYEARRLVLLRCSFRVGSCGIDPAIRLSAPNRWFNGPYHHAEHRVDHSVASDDPMSTVDTPLVLLRWV